MLLKLNMFRSASCFGLHAVTLIDTLENLLKGCLSRVKWHMRFRTIFKNKIWSKTGIC